ncbi:5'-methylthioadenosine/S-adenosylhomocysteine nucleosidase [Caloramator sp. E03]|uniref:5'-methylthioadenosine/S-adenosylhomocysteine nucleosidase family protein n=1 Tax=Caloramator sp. E03 TaxID=2576307 RepID=UPI001110D9C0|nr:5'-methylthioadenosine/S-adenosylhomocysteine nucleosidase [Caloramator sp. E03]QCX33261.1 5'-methylthioadenosine/S-adenosylhomocysteine nucleosidase [Caloramator sp. E03]
MVFIVTALMLEASPLIEYFSLKKDMKINNYQVYKNSDIALVISGVGKIKSAMAAIYLLSTFKSKKEDILINIGFCGTNSLKYALGELIAINKVKDMDTGKDYYPDVYFGKNIPKETLCCSSKPIFKEDYKEDKDMLFDMESVGIMEAGQKFLYTHNTVILKIISDFLTPKDLDKEMLKDYIKNNIPYIVEIIDELKNLNDSSKISFEEEERAVNLLCESLNFTEAMKKMLFKEVKKSKLKGLEPLNILNDFSCREVKIKKEGKRVFEQIIEKLK